MQLPLQITFRDVQPSPAIAEHVRRRTEKLDVIFERLTSCRVAIESPNRNGNLGGRHYHVRIDVTLPGAEIVAGRHHANVSDADCHVAIDRSFDEAARLIKDHMDKVRVRRRNGTPHGRVLRMFRDRGYGFLEGIDGREIYFHQNSVLHGRFHALQIGSQVRYAEEDGEKGPQASTVELAGPPRRTSAWHGEEERERPSRV